MAGLLDFDAPVPRPNPRRMGLLMDEEPARPDFRTRVRDFFDPSKPRGPFAQALIDNQAALAGLSAGLVDGRGGFGRGMAGFAQGSVIDRQRRQEDASAASQAEERKQRVEAVRQWAQERVAAGKMTPSDARLLEAYGLDAAKLFEGPGRDALMNAGNGQIYDPNTGEWIMAPDGGQQDAPTIQEFYNPETQAVEKRAWNPQTGQWDTIGFGKPPSGMVIESDGQGGFRMVQGPMNANGRPPTESQANANIYASRMEAAEPIIQQFEREGTNFWQTLAGNAGLVGNYLLTPEFQQFKQAKEDFLRAVLRKESGAVITDQEMRGGDQQYFPRPGDSDEVIAQKRQNRITATQAIREASGPLVGPIRPNEQGGGDVITTPDGITIRRLD